MVRVAERGKASMEPGRGGLAPPADSARARPWVAVPAAPRRRSSRHACSAVASAGSQARAAAIRPPRHRRSKTRASFRSPRRAPLRPGPWQLVQEPVRLSARSSARRSVRPSASMPLLAPVALPPGRERATAAPQRAAGFPRAGLARGRAGPAAPPWVRASRRPEEPGASARRRGVPDRPARPQ